MPRLFLTIVGLLYLGLAGWCSFAPARTSQKVGFSLSGGSGSSEFLTVYGGLEFGLAIVFLLPWLDASVTRFSLLGCLIIHGSLVAFRSISLLMYSNIEATTYKLAVGEWAIFLCGVVVWFLSSNQVAKT